MYSYFIGEVIEIEDDLLVLECNNIGYNIHVTSRMVENLQTMNEQVKIYTYTYVKEDTLQLFGFSTREEIRLFRLIIGVSGIGPKGAMAILSMMDADTFRVAVLTSDAKAISKAPGIGQKTAERLIIDLKDKVSLDEVSFMNTTSRQESNALNDSAAEAVEALTALGYSASDALRAVKSVSSSKDMDSETILKSALRFL